MMYISLLNVLITLLVVLIILVIVYKSQKKYYNECLIKFIEDNNLSYLDYAERANPSFLEILNFDGDIQ